VQVVKDYIVPHPNIMISVEALNLENMTVGKEYEFTVEARLEKGLNQIRLVYPFDIAPNSDIQLRLRIHEKPSGKDLLKTYPRCTFGDRNDTHYVNMSKSSDVTVKYYIKRTCGQVPEPNIVFCPEVRCSVFRRLHDIVDEVLVINLESRADKRHGMSARLDYLDIDHTFVRAVDGRDDAVYKAWFNHVKNRRLSAFEQRLGRPELYYCGAWGYNETYIRIFEDAVKRGLKAIAIFDDDVYFHKDFNHRIDTLSRQDIFNSADLIYLGSRLRDGDRSAMPELITDVRNPVLGSYGIIVRSGAFSDILNALKRREHVVDGEPLNAVVREKRALILRDPLVIPEYEGSDIRPDRDSKSMYATQGVSVENYDVDVYARHTYSISHLVSNAITSVPSMHAVIGLKCKNRVSYVRDFLTSFSETRSPDVFFKIYVADTSSDEKAAAEIRDLAQSIDTPNTSVVYLRFRDASVTDLSNGILSEIHRNDMQLIPTIFMADEDVKFKKSGWDVAYIRAIHKSPYKHLVFFDTDWRAPSKSAKTNSNGVRLEARADFRTAQGAFFALSSDLLERVGIYNNKLFPTKGGGHLNYTYRLYKELGLDTDLIYDIHDSHKYVQLQPRQSYIGTGGGLSLFHQVRVNSDEVRDSFDERIQCVDRCFNLYKPL
jgi:GR25 family glycosyltransferase involved in LPS biosynthesis